MRSGDRYVAQNRRARHDYVIEDTLEAGLVLKGTEVKVLRNRFAGAGAMRSGDRYVAQNRRARHDYVIEDTLEAGLVLKGTEVKVLRNGQASIAESYASAEGGELYLINANIPEYPSSAHFNHEPRRPRKLLLHRKEMNRLLGAIRREGVTVVPLSIYFNERGRAKVALGLAHGRRKADKREAERARDWQRSRARIMREQGD